MGLLEYFNAYCKLSLSFSVYINKWNVIFVSYFKVKPHTRFIHMEVEMSPLFMKIKGLLIRDNYKG